MFIKYNANPLGKQVGDCTVRALSHALNQSWEETYIGLAIEGFIMCDMPSANSVFGAYLRKKDFQRHIIPNDLPVDYTVEDFCRDNPKGNFILALHGHILSVVDGNYYDSWQSGNEIPVYYWSKGEN